MARDRSSMFDPDPVEPDPSGPFFDDVRVRRDTLELHRREGNGWTQLPVESSGVSEVLAATDVDPTALPPETETDALRQRRRAWWSRTSGKLRFDAPAGMPNVLDPYYGEASKRDTDPATTRAAIINAIEDANANNIGGGGGAIYAPAGTYRLDGPILDATNYVDELAIVGDGKLSTIFKLAPEAELAGAPGPIIDMRQAAGAQPARVILRDVHFQSSYRPGATGVATPTDPYSVEFPLLRIGGGDLTDWQSVFVWYAYGNGVEIARSDLGGTSAADTWRFYALHAVRCLRAGLYIGPGGLNNVIVGGEFTNNETGVHIVGNGQLSQALIQGVRCEQNGNYSVLFENCQGVRLTDSYLFKAPVYLDRDTHGCEVAGNLFYDADQPSNNGVGTTQTFGGFVIDDGFNNRIGPNEGVGWPHRELRRGVPLDELLPASHMSDDDMAVRSVTPLWSTVSASATKGARSDTALKVLAQFTKGPMRITPSSSGTPGGVSQDVPVTAGDSYLIEAVWGSEGASSQYAKARVRILNAADSSELHNTGTQTQSMTSSTAGPNPTCTRFCFQVPAGVTAIRCEIVSMNANTNAMHLYRFRAIRLASANGGMQGTYASGVAPGWAVQDAGGTMTEEATTVDTGLGYAKAQKITIAPGSTSASISQTVPVDGHRFYLAKARVLIPSAGQDDIRPRDRLRFVWGTLASGASNQQWSVRGPRRYDRWETLMRVFRPGQAQTKLAIGLNPNASAGAVMFLQEAWMVPLKDSISRRTFVSAEITLSAASPSVLVGASGIDAKIKEITLVVTEATSADAGVAVNVGHAGDPDYYATLTSPQSAAQDTQQTLTLLRDDLRSGRPIRLSSPGGKTGAGKVLVIVEFE